MTEHYNLPTRVTLAQVENEFGEILLKMEDLGADVIRLKDHISALHNLIFTCLDTDDNDLLDLVHNDSLGG